MDTDNLCGGLVFLLAMLDVLGLEHALVFNFSRLINSSVDLSSTRFVGSLSVGLTKDILTLNALDVTSVAYR